MFEPYAHILFLNPVPGKLSEWYGRPEFQYPLAFGLLILLILILSRVPDVLATFRGRHHDTLRPIDLEELMAGAHPVIVDLRPAEEFNGPRGHLRGAYNIPPAQLARRIGEAAPDPRALVVLVDANDVASHAAVPVLKAAGYQWVRVLRGGMRAWRAGRLPVAVTGHRA